ncbi:hypothetical protein EC845_3191 [Comamonas sp. BIGb0124]|nr:hypothetical protein EC845_3191 [Comamonas sp. BIGb0124]
MMPAMTQRPSPFDDAPEQDVIDSLTRSTTIAVIGLGPRTDRASYGVATYLQSHGYRIVPVHPDAGEVLGEKAYPTLTQAAAEHNIDLVDIFRRSSETDDPIDEAMAIGARFIWLPLGVRNDSAIARARQAGFTAVQNRCLKIEHMAYISHGRL